MNATVRFPSNYYGLDMMYRLPPFPETFSLVLLPVLCASTTVSGVTVMQQAELMVVAGKKKCLPAFV
jgi:hypothetical protein